MNHQGAIIILNKQENEPHHFHGCPECSATKGPEGVYYNGKDAFGACHTHRYGWALGGNILSGWKLEFEEAGNDWDAMLSSQEARWQEIADYRNADALEAAETEASDVELAYDPAADIPF